MAETKAYVAIGEEAARGTAQKTTVGFIPVRSFTPPKPDFMEKKREEYRGENTALGPTTAIRMGQKWDGLSLEMPGFTEAGTVTGILGTLFKHFFGQATSAQNGTTGQYAHMMYPVTNPYDSTHLGDTPGKALTVNMNFMYDATIKNHPYIGGMVKTIKLSQELGEPLVITAELMGQTIGVAEAGIASPVFPAENLRLDYNNLTIRNGATVTRTGTAPNYTNITSTGAQVKADSISVEFDFGKEDHQLLDGTTTTGKRTVKEFTGKLSLTIDFEDPASGFSSIDEFTAWLAGTSSTNFLLTWDSGTAAGTGNNHAIIVDLPLCNRLGGMPDLPRDGQAKITLEYEFLFDSTTTLYAAGLLLKNTASAV